MTSMYIQYLAMTSGTSWVLNHSGMSTQISEVIDDQEEKFERGKNYKKCSKDCIY